MGVVPAPSIFLQEMSGRQVARGGVFCDFLGHAGVLKIRMDLLRIPAPLQAPLNMTLKVPDNPDPLK